jgi:Transposase IS116/IS110/IS902 family
MRSKHSQLDLRIFFCHDAEERDELAARHSITSSARASKLSGTVRPSAFGKMTRKQIAALVGLAPYDFDSGKLKGHRSIYGGRMPVRNVLYIVRRQRF